MRHLAAVLVLFVALAASASVLAQDDPVVARADAQAELAALRVRYGERHPEVVAARARADALAGATTNDPCGVQATLAARLAAVDQELGANRRYGSSHPTIRALEGRRAAYAAAIAAAPDCAR